MRRAWLFIALLVTLAAPAAAQWNDRGDGTPAGVSGKIIGTVSSTLTPAANAITVTGAYHAINGGTFHTISGGVMGQMIGLVASAEFTVAAGGNCTGYTGTVPVGSVIFGFYNGTTWRLGTPGVSGGFARLTGGNTFTGDQTINGNVGIGGAPGPQKFKVYGASGEFTQHLYADGTAGQSYGLLIDAGTSSADAALTVRDRSGASTFLTVRGSGLVGIGGTPSEKFDVNGAVAVRAANNSLVANTGLFDFSGGDARVISRGPNAATNGGFKLYTSRSDGTNLLTIFDVSSSGNVGIGGTPTYNLDVQKAGDVIVRAKASNSTGAANIFVQAGDGTTSSRYAFGEFHSSETVPQDWLYGMRGTKSFVIRDETAGADRLTIDTSGIVTIPGSLRASNTSLSGGILDLDRTTAGAATTYINDAGLSGGYTQFRTLKIRDGKGADIATFDGPTGASTVSGTAFYASGLISPVGITFANLGTPGNGTLAYCTDCTIANPCASGGTGALAKRLNGVWVCN